MVKIFIPQQISEVAYKKLQTLGDVTMYEGTCLLYTSPSPRDRG